MQTNEVIILFLTYFSGTISGIFICYYMVKRGPRGYTGQPGDRGEPGRDGEDGEDGEDLRFR